MRFPYDDAIQLAKMVRPLLPRGRSLLYHGSRSPAQILRADALLVPDAGIPAVSLSRLLHVAIYWATQKRESEQVGAVFVLDRDRLAQTYKLEPFRDPIWDYYPERRARKSSEAEEQVYCRDVRWLNRFLVDVIWFAPDGSLHSTVERRAERLIAYCRRRPTNLSAANQAKHGGARMTRLVLPATAWLSPRTPPADRIITP